MLFRFLFVLLPAVTLQQNNSTQNGTTVPPPVPEPCDGSKVVSMVDPYYFFFVTYDCHLLLSYDPIPEVDMLRNRFGVFSRHGPCLVRRPIVFPIGEKEIGIIAYITQEYLFFRIDTTNLPETGIEDHYLFDNSYRMAAVKYPDMTNHTCHMDEVKKEVICYSPASPRSTVIVSEKNKYNPNSGVATFVKGGEPIRLPHWTTAALNPETMLSYYSYGNHIWMDHSLHFLYNMEVEDYYRYNRTLLTTHNIDTNGIPVKAMLYGDSAGVVTAHCTSRKCTMQYNAFSSISMMKSACLAELPIIHTMGAFAIGKRVEPTTTTTTGAPIPEPAALISGQIRELAHGNIYCFTPLLILAILTFIYLILYSVVLFRPAKKDNLIQLNDALEAEIKSHLLAISQMQERMNPKRPNADVVVKKEEEAPEMALPPFVLERLRRGTKEQQNTMPFPVQKRIEQAREPNPSYQSLPFDKSEEKTQESSKNGKGSQRTGKN